MRDEGVCVGASEFCLKVKNYCLLFRYELEVKCLGLIGRMESVVNGESRFGGVCVVEKRVLVGGIVVFRIWRR